MKLYKSAANFKKNHFLTCFIYIINLNIITFLKNGIHIINIFTYFFYFKIFNFYSKKIVMIMINIIIDIVDTELQSFTHSFFFLHIYCRLQYNLACMIKILVIQHFY